MARWCVVLVVVGVLLGCRPTVRVNGHTVREDIWQSTTRKVGAKARKDLRCPAPHPLRFTLIAMRRSRPARVSVGACGKHAQYKYGRVLAYWRRDHSVRERLGPPLPPPRRSGPPGGR